MDKINSEKQNQVSTSQLSDKDLHQRLVQLKSKESHIVALIIVHLQEVYRRRLFADFGCSSIYDYCIRILGYSSGEAHKKISACKLVTQVSEVRESIATGELSLTNAASVQTLISKIQQSKREINKEFNRQNEQLKESSTTLNQEVVRSLVERVKNKSTRECEKELAQIAKEFKLVTEAPQPFRRNRDDLAQVQVCLNRENLDNLKRELGIACEQQLIDQLISEKLNQLLEKKKAALQAVVTPKAHKAAANPRSISQSKRAIVMKKAQGKCENCGSEANLQIDHKKSVALGGCNDLENLRVLCRPCNQRAAIRQLGIKKMEPYLIPPKSINAP